MIRIVLLALLIVVWIPAVEVQPVITTAGETTATEIVAPGAVSATNAATAAPAQILTLPTLVPPVAQSPSPSASGSAPATLIQAPGLTVSLGGDASRNWSTPVVILLAITALSVAPAFLMMMTSFTRIIIVLGFLRRALGTQTLPPNQVLAGLALFLSLFVMAPTFNRINDQALQPLLKETISQQAALDLGSVWSVMAGGACMCG